MKIGIIIPTRNNRPDFLANCLRMVAAQTVQPDIIKVVDDSPRDEKIDITWRYRVGYDFLRDKALDAIFLMEDDDWYAPDYLETMLFQWIQHGQPDIFGLDYTIYYHIYLKKYFRFDHDDRSSAMSTLIKPDLTFDWCDDHEAYTDMHLFTVIKNKAIWHPPRHICMGIKHGIGMTGGMFHNSRTDRFNMDDIQLSQVMDPASFDFYDNYFARRPDQAQKVQQDINRNFNLR